MTMSQHYSLPWYIALAGLLAVFSTPNIAATGPDPFSFANFNQIRMTHLALDLKVDFDAKQLTGTAVLTLKKHPGKRVLVLDTEHLNIRKVEQQRPTGWARTDFTLGSQDRLLGRALTIAVDEGSNKVRVTYNTTAKGSGLQWLDPAMTSSKTAPFMFSQSEAIHGRSWIPMQDTPAIKITYTAHLSIPKGLRALMSANNDPAHPLNGDFRFKMDQPIAPYLIAIAVGNLRFHAWSKRTGVWAEPDVLPLAAKEFEDTEAMVAATEKLFGPYRWGRYDLLILPPSFPFGGMENPRLSFITPTVLVGDKSLVSLISHELAHSWSGNLVTNARWADFWLNEGITSYLENRIVEEVYGASRARVEQVLDYRNLISKLKTIPRDQQALVQNLKGRDPDDIPSAIAYIKGQQFMFYLEHHFGRKKLDRFLRQYFDHFQFKTVTSRQFALFLNRHLLEKYKKARIGKMQIAKWLFEPGIPASARAPVSKKLQHIDRLVAKWSSHAIAPAAMDARKWSTQEWVYFLKALPQKISIPELTKLDHAFHLSQSHNKELLLAWFPLTIRNHYQPARMALKHYLMSIGRMRMVVPLYGELARDPTQRSWALKVFEQARRGYHPMTISAVRHAFAPSAEHAASH